MKWNTYGSDSQRKNTPWTSFGPGSHDRMKVAKKQKKKTLGARKLPVPTNYRQTDFNTVLPIIGLVIKKYSETIWKQEPDRLS